MERAVLLIGVQRSGSLARLQAVADGVTAMEEWARAQRIATIEVLTDGTDGSGQVGIADIVATVTRIIEDGPPDQLLVYFAGHGISKFHSEYWLLSDAPTLAHEAVNVTASANLARRCGIGHVVLVSDACRTAPEGIDAQAVTGAPIFPNISGARPGAVDQFFANRVGEPAYEIADPSVSAGRFTSAYTDVLTRSLGGTYSEMLEEVPDEPGQSVLRPWPLNRALPDLLLTELEELGVDLTISQEPEALITSDPARAWLSKLAATRSFVLRPEIPMPPSTTEVVADAVIRAIDGDAGVLQDLAQNSGASGELVSRIADEAAELAAIDWSLVDHVSPALRVLGGEVARTVQGVGATFVEFANGCCTNLAQLPGRECCAYFVGDELVSVHWVESSAELRPDGDHDRLARSLMALASRSGVLRFDLEQADRIWSNAEGGGGADPAVRLYATYAGAEMLPTHGIASPFDVVLAGDPDSQSRLAGQLMWPGFPMLSRGVPMLGALDSNALGVTIALELGAHLLPSHWSLFDLAAAEQLLALLEVSAAAEQ